MKVLKARLSQGFMMILLSIGMMNHVFIIPFLLQSSGRDAWISVTLSILPLMAVTAMTYYVAKRLGNRSIHEWLSQEYGLAAAVLLRIIMSVFLYMICFYTLFDTTTWAKITFLTETPISVTTIVMLLLCLYAAIMGFKPIAISAGILLPFVVLLGFFIMTVNFQTKDYSQLLPVLSKGWGPVFSGLANSCAGSFEIIMYLFLKPKLAKAAKAWQLYVLALALTGLTMGPLIGAITIFDPYEASRQMYPAYEEWRVATIGRYVAQTDFFSIYQWLSGAFIRISLALYFIVDVWNIKEKLPRIGAYVTVAGLILLISLTGLNDTNFLKLLKRFYFPFSAAFLGALILILFALALISSGKKGKEHHDN
ncbi:endospore germination permease [Paenibacillus sp. Y412MC10]|uniref:endospore germination permease n=1 Tax=Geobacillus sp. (strain Y412MC10) TaxID=481743 RepID=UPI00119D9355|nr:endospore germination permease [Paenibacillus sp. Y412MC10]